MDVRCFHDQSCRRVYVPKCRQVYRNNLHGILDWKIKFDCGQKKLKMKDCEVPYESKYLLKDRNKLLLGNVKKSF